MRPTPRDLLRGGMEFRAYPKTGKLRDAAGEAAHRGRGTVAYRGTVKAHGTHIDIVRESGAVHYQSRNRVIDEEHDNCGFVRWMKEKDCEGLLAKASATEDVMLGCEFCGGNIQKGVALTQLPKFLLVFAVRVDGHWKDAEEYRHVEDPDRGIHNVRGFRTFDTEVDLSRPDIELDRLRLQVDEVVRECPIGAQLGATGPGEGIVWVPRNTGLPVARFMFKVKGEDFETVCRSRVAEGRTKSSEDERLRAACQGLLTDARLEQGMQYLEEMGIPHELGSIPKFAAWAVGDVLAEDQDVLKELACAPEAVSKALSKAAAQWFRRRVGVN